MHVLVNVVLGGYPRVFLHLPDCTHLRPGGFGLVAADGRTHVAPTRWSLAI